MSFKIYVISLAFYNFFFQNTYFRICKFLKEKENTLMKAYKRKYVLNIHLKQIDKLD